jgi:hypothetical protein
MTKNGPNDFAQGWAIYMKNPIRFMAKRKMGVTRHFWALKMHVKIKSFLDQRSRNATG